MQTKTEWFKLRVLVFINRYRQRWMRGKIWMHLYSSYCISDNIFRVHMVFVKCHVLVMLLMSSVCNSLLTKYRVKGSAGCFFVLKWVSMKYVCRPFTVCCTLHIYTNGSTQFVQHTTIGDEGKWSRSYPVLGLGQHGIGPKTVTVLPGWDQLENSLMVLTTCYASVTA